VLPQTNLERGEFALKLPIPLTVLTGYLGSGKTTLLKALLKHPDMSGTAVIVNEFGEVGLDDALIEAATEETVLLPSGCVCCTVRGDLVEALLKLHKAALWGEIPPLQRVVIETTGLADPAPIAHTLITERDLFRLFRLDAIVTTADAQHGLGQLDAAFEPAKQIAVADRIVLTKTDIADPSASARLESRLRALNPAAPILPAVKGAIAPGELFGLDAYEIRSSGQDVESWIAAERYAGSGHACEGEHCDHPDHHHGHDHGEAGHLHGVASFCLTFEAPLDPRKLELAIEMLRSVHGNQLLRLKGLINVAGEDKPFVIHGVQHVFYPVETLESWPSEDRRSRIVFITRDLGESRVREFFAPLLSEGSPATAA
jgi:G3E family GTPase